MQKIKKQFWLHFGRLQLFERSFDCACELPNIISLHLKKIDRMALYLKTRKVG